MQVARLDHVNIRTPRLAETVAFYADVLELVAGDPPPPLDPRRIQWMFGSDGHALFHLTMPGSLEVGAAQASAADTGAIHHVALDCTGYAAMIARLDARGIAHRDNHNAAIDLRQIFVTDPNGVLLELNYRAGNH